MDAALMWGQGRAAIGTSGALVIALMVSLAASPIAIDNLHMDDIQFLSHLGWRGLHGLRPVLDYPHFYGGVVAEFVRIAFVAFGVSYKSVDYAILLLFLVPLAAMAVVGYRRVSVATAALVVLLSAVVLLSRLPMEHHKLIGSAHSYVYNHFAVALMAVLTVFACFRGTHRAADIIAALVCGGLLTVLALTKPTFVIFLPFFFAALAVQRRWLAIGLSVSALLVSFGVLDFGGQRFFGAFGHLLDAAAEEGGGVIGITITLFQMILRQPLAVVAAVLLVLDHYRRTGRESLIFLASLGLLALGHMGAVATMGNLPRAQALPLLLLICVLTVELSRQSQSSRWQTKLPSLLIWCLAGYAVANSVLVSGIAAKSRHAALIYDGPAADYVVYGRTLLDAVDGVADRPTRQTRANMAAAKNIENGGPIDESVEYIIWADGVRLLRGITDVGQYGIVSNGRMFDFTVPLMAKPVVSMPPWPSRSVLRAMPMAPLAADVDLVMMARNVPENPWMLVTQSITDRMGRAFEPCRESSYWVLHKRIGSAGVGCD